MDVLNDLELFESAFQATTDGILVIDEEGLILRTNPSLDSMFGFVKKDLIQNNMKSLFPNLWAQIRESKGLDNRNKSHNLKDKTITWGYKKDGSQIPLEVRWIFKTIQKEFRILVFVRDITTKELIGQELHIQEVKNKALLEAIPDMMFILNNKGDFVDFYIPEHQETLFSKEEMGNAKIVDLFPSKMYPDLHKSYSKIVKTRENQQVELRIDKNGLKDYEIRLVPMNNLNVMGIVREITEAKQVESSLRREKEKLQQYLNIAASMFVVINIDHRIELVNDKACEVLGYQKEELLGKDWFHTCLPEEERAMILEMFDDVMNSKKPLEGFYENHIITKKGKKRLIRWRNSMLTDSNGKAISSLSSGIDITERKATLDMLHLRNRALEAASNSIIISDAKKTDMPIIFSNDAFQKMTGYSENEILGKNCRFLQSDDRDQEEIAIIRRALDQGEGCQVELRNYKKDGTLFWNQLTITPVHDKAGKLTHFIGVQRDITERVKEEQLQVQVRQILEMATKNRPLKEICEEIVKGVEAYLNRGRAVVYAVNPYTKRLQTLAAPHVPKSFLAGVEGVSVGQKKCSCCTAAYLKEEVIVSDIEASEEWKELGELALKNDIRASWSFPIADSTDEVLGTFTIYLDQTVRPSKRELEVVKDMAKLSGLAAERHTIKRKLEESQKQLQEYAKSLEKEVSKRTAALRKTVMKLVETNQRLTEQSQLAKTNQEIFSAIAQNFPKGVIFVFNAQMEFVFIEGEELSRINLNKDDFKGKHIDDISVFSENRMNRIKDDIRKTLDGEHLSFEIDYGTEVYAVNSAPLKAIDDTVWALFVYSNITEQKQVEKEIRRNLQKEKELSELKSRFVSMASHEFRTPLSAILSSAILIEKQNAPDKVEKRKKYVDQIKSNVRNLVVILNDFLSLGKLEEGKTVSHPEYFNLLDLTAALIEEMTADKKDAQTVVLNHQGEPIPVFLDPKLTRHILINLLSNAMKYSQSDTTILVSVVFKEDEVLLHIKDQGIGIPLGEQEHLFERFFRARNSENIQGTGIGLHIVKQYVELMNGEVTFISEEGIGTTFTLSFPINSTIRI
ncbi:PAS domain S-box protein [Muricauda sp. JGD-17]|uniref:histidine kinase n=1 Tax=Flagellimonas ochracea TaxID=2696472 RepID=A0A964WWU1_9FLAO|nr:PAS domain S-box protein [Allomuricauda ochracea]NAY91360.1 PAS domain S-box protein [Allomuricauda ochracea]